LAEEVFNPVACLVPFAVVRALILTVGPGWDHRRFPGLRQRLQHPLVRIVALVGNDNRCLNGGQQSVRSCQITRLSGRQQKARRVAQGIDGGVNLGAQTALAASDRLVLAFFF
jgi:hypothetical protein